MAGVGWVPVQESAPAAAAAAGLGHCGRRSESQRETSGSPSKQHCREQRQAETGVMAWVGFYLSRPSAAGKVVIYNLSHILHIFKLHFKNQQEESGTISGKGSDLLSDVQSNQLPPSCSVHLAMAARWNRDINAKKIIIMTFITAAAIHFVQIPQCTIVHCGCAVRKPCTTLHEAPNRKTVEAAESA